MEQMTMPRYYEPKRLPFKARTFEQLFPESFVAMEDPRQSKRLHYVIASELDDMAKRDDLVITECLNAAAVAGLEYFVTCPLRGVMPDPANRTTRQLHPRDYRALMTHTVQIAAVEAQYPVTAKNAMGRATHIGYRPEIRPVGFFAPVVVGNRMGTEDEQAERAIAAGGGVGLSVTERTVKTWMEPDGGTLVELGTYDALSCLQQTGAFVRRCPPTQERLLWRCREVHKRWPLDGKQKPKAGPCGPIRDDNGDIVDERGHRVNADGLRCDEYGRAITPRNALTEITQ
jgi:hypothetical protein